MTMLATLIAIAAWCGQPNGYYNAQHVDQCRQDILQCLDKTPRNAQCFISEQLSK